MSYHKNAQENFITYDMFLDGTDIVFARFNPDGQLHDKEIKRISIVNYQILKTKIPQLNNNQLVI